jgi:hypothetical protein
VGAVVGKVVDVVGHFAPGHSLQAAIYGDRPVFRDGHVVDSRWNACLLRPQARTLSAPFALAFEASAAVHSPGF